MPERFPLDLSAPEAARAALAGPLAASGLHVPHAGRAPLFQVVTVAVRLPGGAAAEVDGQVVNQAPGGGFFVHVAEAAAVARLRGALEAALAAAASAGPAAGGRGADPGADALPGDDLGGGADPDGLDDASDGDDLDGDDDGDDPDADAEDDLDDDEDDLEDEDPDGGRRGPIVAMKPAHELIDTQSEVPIHKQIAELSVRDKIRLARQATRPVRRILIHDVEKRIHLAVVKNPKVKEDELAEYAQMGGLSPQALVWLSKQGRAMRRKDIVFSLVVNPATPQDVARKLLARLSQQELVRVLRSSKAREAVRRMAKKKLMQAGVI